MLLCGLYRIPRKIVGIMMTHRTMHDRTVMSKHNVSMSCCNNTVMLFLSYLLFRKPVKSFFTPLLVYRRSTTTSKPGSSAQLKPVTSRHPEYVSSHFGKISKKLTGLGDKQRMIFMI